MIKEENIFWNCIEIREKVSNIIKKVNSKLIFHKKYIKAEKNSTQKKAFDVFIYQ